MSCRNAPSVREHLYVTFILVNIYAIFRNYVTFDGGYLRRIGTNPRRPISIIAGVFGDTSGATHLFLSFIFSENVLGISRVHLVDT